MRLLNHPHPERPDEEHEAVLAAFKRELGEDIERRSQIVADGAYRLRTDALLTLDLHIDADDRFITVEDIEVVDEGHGDGTDVVTALRSVAKELGYSLRAHNVRPEKESWWSGLGFREDERDPSGDYWLDTR